MTTIPFQPTILDRNYVPALTPPSILTPVSDIGSAKSHTFSKGELISSQGYNLWLIKSGLVRTSTWDEYGVCFCLGVWGEHDLIGEALSTVDPYQIECLTTVVVTPLSGIEHCSREVLLKQIQRSEELMRTLYCGTLEERFLRMLFWLTRRFGHQTSQGWLLDVRLTHQDFADTMNTSRVSITRLLSKYRQQGILHWSENRRLIIRSLP